MTKMLRILALSTLLVTVPSMALVAQDTSNRTVGQYTCKDVMADSDDNRATAIAFLHGYLLGKAGNEKFNLEVLAKQTDAFIDQCLDNPKDKAVDVMTKVKQ